MSDHEICQVCVPLSCDPDLVSHLNHRAPVAMSVSTSYPMTAPAWICLQGRRFLTSSQANMRRIARRSSHPKIA
jgi:hypothetical protein